MIPMRVTAMMVTAMMLVAAAPSFATAATTANPAWARGANGGRLGNGTTDDR